MTCPPYLIVCLTRQLSWGSYTFTSPSSPPLNNLRSPCSLSPQHRLVMVFWWLLSALTQKLVPVSSSSSAPNTPAPRLVLAPSMSHTRRIGPPALTASVPWSPTATASTGLPWRPIQACPPPSDAGTRASQRRTVPSYPPERTSEGAEGTKAAVRT